MNHNEVVKALSNTCTGCNPTPCCEFEVLGQTAANMIETLRNELCLKCGAYKQSHKGACSHCRWRDEE